MKQTTPEVLLVALNAKFIHSSLALRSLQSYCRKYKSQLEIAEYTINHQTDFILRDIYKKQPKAIGFSCYIWNIEYIISLVKVLKQVMPNTKVFLGGPEVSYDCQGWMKEHPEIDLIIQGEGEQTLFELLEYLQPNSKITDLKDISGIYYRLNDKIEKTAPRLPIELDDIPFVYDEQEFDTLKNQILYYESTRGCPYNCQYCLSSIEDGVRYRSLERVFKDLQTFLDQEVKQVKFVDRTFNCHPKRTLAIWEYLKEHDNGVTNFHFEISADILTEEMLEFLQTIRPKQFQFEIGVQSTHLPTIEYIKRKMDLKELSEVVKKIKEGRNIHQHLDLIAGLPGEGYETFGKSFNDVYHLQPEKLQLGFLKLLRGSGLRQDAEKYGLVYQQKAPYEILYTDDLPYLALLQLKMIEEMVEIYYNGGKFSNTINYITPYFSSPFHLYEALAMYWEQQGYHAIQHNKYQLYQILLDFVLNTKPEINQEQLVEVLLLDMYLQENVKSRPAFSNNHLDDATKQRTREFLRDEKTISTYLPQLEGYQPRQINRMVHIELFQYDWINWMKRQSNTPPVREETPILFNYYDRSHILGQAACYKVSL